MNGDDDDDDDDDDVAVKAERAAAAAAAALMRAYSADAACSSESGVAGERSNMNGLCVCDDEVENGGGGAMEPSSDAAAPVRGAADHEKSSKCTSGEAT